MMPETWGAASPRRRRHRKPRCLFCKACKAIGPLAKERAPLEALLPKRVDELFTWLIAQLVETDYRVMVLCGARGEAVPHAERPLPRSFDLPSLLKKSAPARRAALLRAEDGRTDFSGPIVGSFGRIRNGMFVAGRAGQFRSAHKETSDEHR
jgi:hypothetical protein